jgi:hypothetical protein
MTAGGYESWFVSAQDPASPRALWIRHTRHRPSSGPESAALWCTLFEHSAGQRPIVVKQVLADFPPTVVAGPRQFRGSAAMGERTATWDLSISTEQQPLMPLRPAVLQRAPRPRTKVEVSVPDGTITGALEVDGHPVSVSGWRGTVGHNWGSEHADSWVWLHAADFGAQPDCWLELVLARIRIGQARLPWAAMGAISIGGARIPLGGLGRRPRMDVRPAWLTAEIPSPASRLELRITTSDEDAVAVPYADPSGGRRAVRHAALASVDLTLRRAGDRDVVLSSSRGAYEYGTSQDIGEMPLEPLPAG